MLLADGRLQVQKNNGDDIVVGVPLLEPIPCMANLTSCMAVTGGRAAVRGRRHVALARDRVHTGPREHAARW